MPCTDCGSANPDGAQSCASCGRPLNAVWQPPTSELVSATCQKVVYGGFWARFAACILDGLLVIAAWLALFFLLTLALGEADAADDIASLQHSLPLIMFGFYCALVLPVVAYFVLMESGECGATLGKRALKLRVVEVRGKRIGIGRALGRFLAHFLSGSILCIGYLIQPFTGRKQALHDLLAGTLVIRTDRTGNGFAVGLSVVGGFFFVMVAIGILASIAVPKYQDYLAKANMLQAEEVGWVATRAVGDYVAHTGKMPASLAETGVKLPFAGEAADVTSNPQNGQVWVVIGQGMPATVAGKALVFDASRGADGKIVWTCSGPGIPLKMLPADCR